MGPHLLQGARTEELRQLIAAEINETDDDKLAHNIGVLDMWMKTQPHLPENYDRRILKGFLRGCKHNLETCKRKLDAYFSIRNSEPEFFHDRDPRAKELQQLLNSTLIAPIPVLSPNGYRVTYHKIPTDFDPVDLVRVLLMIGDVRVLEESLVRGDIFVWDMSQFRMSTLSRIMATPAIKKILLITQEAFPQRMQQIHLINCNPVAEKLAQLFKLFMKPKMRNRWFLHTSHINLTKYLPLECIPQDYEGMGDPMEKIHDSWKQKLYEYSDWFMQQESISTDESKRPVDKKEKDKQEAMQGTFRQIQFD